jgi:hypothetical protein
VPVFVSKLGLTGKIEIKDREIPDRIRDFPIDLAEIFRKN